MPRLPTPRTAGTYRISLVCLGNICRSPMADVVLSAQVREAGLDDSVEVRSSGSGDWHVGKPMDRRAAATLTAAGFDPSRHRAQQFAPARLVDDLVLAMDASNLADVLASASSDEPARSATGEDARIRLFRDFDPVDPGGEVPDPYYGGDDGFEEVLAMVERTAAALVAELRLVLPRGVRTP